MEIRQFRRRDEKEVSRQYRALHSERSAKWKVEPHRFKARNRLLVAETKGRILGFVWATWVGIGREGVGYIDELYVDEPARGRNVGRKLIHAAMRWLRSFGPLEVAFVSTDKNHAKFYERMGFKTCVGPWLWKN